ncbi:MAG: chemotaxis protein CheX [Planctomycetes bacterium]|nr:chemotaxis protein CheX [Planctomycetota bacterium]
MPTVTAADFRILVARALERMAFVVAEPTGESAGEVLARSRHHAAIEITGDDHRAWLLVSATAGFVTEVAAGMMGMDPDEIDADEHGDATVAELANVLGGEFVMALGGDLAPVRLSLPQCLDDAAVDARLDEIADGERGWTVVLAADAGSLLVASRLH